MIWTDDRPYSDFMAVLHGRLVGEAVKVGITFNPATDCAGYQWGQDNPTATFGEFIDQLAEAVNTGSADSGWAYVVVMLFRDELPEATREKLVCSLKRDRAVKVALELESFTPAEIAHLRPICIACAHERPGIARALAEKLGDG